MFKKIILVFIVSLLGCPTNGQFLQKLKEKVKEKTEERIDQKVDEGIDKGLDSIEEAGQEEGEIEEEGVTETTSSSDIATQQELQSYSKFDFVPGEEVIFFDDFSDVPIGDFPLKWNTTASGEVVTLNNYPGKWLKFIEDYSYYSPEMNVVFPENFTIEFDAVYPGDVEWEINLAKSNSDYINDEYYPGDEGINIYFVTDEIYVRYYNNLEDGELRDVGKSVTTYYEGNQKIRFSIWGQGQRLRVYQNEKKVVDIPRAIPKNLKINQLRFGCLTNLFIANFRFAVGAPDTRSRLLTEGKLITRGITFDSGSDVIKPESYGVIKEIADVLKENSSLRIKIIGHTDSDGADDMNLTLSKKRSAAVKNTLEKQFGIDASRMETDGKGESEPVSPNNTSEGKANNRRVEFIKL